MFTRTVLARGAIAMMLIASFAKGADATPITIDAVGDSFAVTMTGASDPSGLPVSVYESWLVTALTPTSVTFQLSFDNTSATTPAQFTGFGFDTNPNALGGTSTSSLFSHVFTSGGGGGFHVCVENDNNSNCFGNKGNIGLQPGDPLHIFALTLTFGDTSGGIVMSNFFARMQGIGTNDASAKVFGEPVCTSGCGNEPPPPLPPPVPEPASITLLAMGVVGSGIAARRRRAGGQRT